MTSRRYANVLFLVIALLLGVIALQLGSRPFIGEAVVQPPMSVTSVVGYYKPSAWGDCDYLPLRVDDSGRLLVSSGK